MVTSIVAEIGPYQRAHLHHFGYLLKFFTLSLILPQCLFRLSLGFLSFLFLLRVQLFL